MSNGWNFSNALTSFSLEKIVSRSSLVRSVGLETFEAIFPSERRIGASVLPFVQAFGPFQQNNWCLRFFRQWWATQEFHRPRNMFKRIGKDWYQQWILSIEAHGYLKIESSTCKRKTCKPATNNSFWRFLLYLSVFPIFLPFFFFFFFCACRRRRLLLFLLLSSVSHSTSFGSADNKTFAHL